MSNEPLELDTSRADAEVDVACALDPISPRPAYDDLSGTIETPRSRSRGRASEVPELDFSQDAWGLVASSGWDD